MLIPILLLTLTVINCNCKPLTDSDNEKIERLVAYYTRTLTNSIEKHTSSHNHLTATEKAKIKVFTDEYLKKFSKDLTEAVEKEVSKESGEVEAKSHSDEDDEELQSEVSDNLFEVLLMMVFPDMDDSTAEEFVDKTQKSLNGAVEKILKVVKDAKKS